MRRRLIFLRQCVRTGVRTPSAQPIIGTAVVPGLIQPPRPGPPSQAIAHAHSRNPTQIVIARELAHG